jgi:hypothetical protein
VWAQHRVVARDHTERVFSPLCRADSSVFGVIFDPTFSIAESAWNSMSIGPRTNCKDDNVYALPFSESQIGHKPPSHFTAFRAFRLLYKLVLAPTVSWLNTQGQSTRE